MSLGPSSNQTHLTATSSNAHAVQSTLSLTATSALLSAARTGNAEGVQQALKNGANASTASFGDGQGPVHLTAKGGFVSVLRILLKALGRGHDAFSRCDDAGRTPLHLAAESSLRSNETTLVLLEAGADLLKLDARGRTTVQIAYAAGNTEAGRAIEHWSLRAGA